MRLPRPFEPFRAMRLLFIAVLWTFALLGCEKLQSAAAPGEVDGLSPVNSKQGAPQAGDEVGTAEPFGGTDRFNEYLDDLRQNLLIPTLSAIRDGQSLDHLCSIETCRREENPLCQELRPSFEQVHFAYCKSFLTAIAPRLLERLKSDRIVLRGSIEPVMAHGVEVTAHTEYSESGEIVVNFDRASEFHPSRTSLAARVLHEFLHKTISVALGGVLRDESEFPPFDEARGGNVLATLASVSAMLYAQRLGLDKDYVAPLPPPPLILVGYGAHGSFSPRIRIINANTGQPVGHLLQNSIGFEGYGGDLRVASGDVNGDGHSDIILGTSSPVVAHVKVVDGYTGESLHYWQPFPGFTGGVFVAAADFNRDGRSDIVVGAGDNGGPHVRVFDGSSLALLWEFWAYDLGMHSGVRVAAGDVNNDGYPDIVTGPGSGAGPHIRVFSGRERGVIWDGTAFAHGWTGGAYVAAGDINKDGHADIIVGAGAGGGSHLQVFSGKDYSQLWSRMVFTSGFTGGVRVAASDLNNDGFSDVIVGAGPGGYARVKVFSGRTESEILSTVPADLTMNGGIFVSKFGW